MKAHRNDKNNKIVQYFIILYQGLKPSKYYWEFINTFRKMLILCSLFLSPTLGILTAVITLILSSRFQIFLAPYKREEINDIELLSLSAGVVTLYSGLIFSQKENQATLDLIIVVITFTINLIFFLNWIYLLTKEYQGKLKMCKKLNVVIAFVLLKHIASTEPTLEFTPKRPLKVKKKLIRKKRKNRKLKKSTLIKKEIKGISGRRKTRYSRRGAIKEKISKAFNEMNEEFTWNEPKIFKLEKVKKENSKEESEDDSKILQIIEELPSMISSTMRERSMQSSNRKLLNHQKNELKSRSVNFK